MGYHPLQKTPWPPVESWIVVMWSEPESRWITITPPHTLERAQQREKDLKVTHEGREMHLVRITTTYTTEEK